MKILKMTTHWTTEEADCIFRLLDEFQSVIWENYGDDITEMYQLMGAEQLAMERDMEDKVPDEIPF
jgi:hypothetical protein